MARVSKNIGRLECSCSADGNKKSNHFRKGMTIPYTTEVCLLYDPVTSAPRYLPKRNKNIYLYKEHTDVPNSFVIT